MFFLHSPVSANAAAEFETIWNEHERTGRPYTLLSDDLSQKLIKLQNEMEESSLYDDIKLRRAGEFSFLVQLYRITRT